MVKHAARTSGEIQFFSLDFGRLPAYTSKRGVLCYPNGARLLVHALLFLYDPANKAVCTRFVGVSSARVLDASFLEPATAAGMF